MPVRRFRSIAEMEPPASYQPGDPALYLAMAMLWNFTRRAHPRRFAPGLLRFRSIDEMNRVQDAAEAAYIAERAARRIAN